MRQYQTKTGVILTVINGQGLGDGVPKAKLKALSDLDGYSLDLLKRFETARIVINRNSYDNETFALEVYFTIDAKNWTKPSKRHGVLGLLTVDVSNYLSRFHGLSQYAVPSVDTSRRSKNGLKHLTFSYSISRETALNMGLSKFETFKVIKAS